jgi:hypothetical protein
MGGEGFSQVVDAPPHGTRHVRKRVDGALLFLFSVCLPPGGNYMYMGLIKRGLAAMCGFFLLIYLTIVISVPMKMLFVFAIPVLYFTCFFDGFNLRRRINSGENVDDGVGDIIGGILRNKFLTAAFLIIIALAMLGFVFELLRRIAPALLVILALYIIFRKK